MILRTGILFILASVPLLADLTGRWSTGGENVFVLRQNGNAVTGLIEGRPGEPTYKIVDGVIRGNQIHFFVLHEDENDPEVKANGGKPFTTWRKGRLRRTRSWFPGLGRTPGFASIVSC
jgi:hypothetical protein